MADQPLVDAPSWYFPEEWRSYETTLLELAQGELHEIPQRYKDFLRQERNLEERRMYELVDYVQAKLQKDGFLFSAPALPKSISNPHSNARIEAYERKLTKVALKLLEDEKKYLDQIEKLDEILKPKILKMSPPPDVEKLLSQTAVLLPMTRTLYRDLEKVIDPDLVEFEDLASLIIEFSHTFKMYHLYAQAYPAAKSWFTNMKESKRKKLQSKVDGQSILEIIKAPILRPTEVISSIAHLRKLSSTVDPDSEMTALLQLAVEELQTADESRKDYIEEVARREVVMEVQKQFSVNVNFIDSHRKLVKEGGLIAIENGKQLQTDCFLFTDQIVIAQKGPKKGLFRKKQTFSAAKLISFTVRSLCGASKSEPTKFWVSSNHFIIHNQKKVNEYRQENEMSYRFNFEVPSPKIRDEWVDLIKSCLPSVATLGRQKYELLLRKETLASLQALMLELGIQKLGLTDKEDVVKYIASTLDRTFESSNARAKLARRTVLRQQFIQETMRKSSTWVIRANSVSSDFSPQRSMSVRRKSRPKKPQSVPPKRSPKRAPEPVGSTPYGPGVFKPRRRVLSKQELSPKSQEMLNNQNHGVVNFNQKEGSDAALPSVVDDLEMPQLVGNGDDGLGIKMDSDPDPDVRKMVDQLYGSSLEREGSITTPEVIDITNVRASSPPSLEGWKKARIVQKRQANLNVGDSHASDGGAQLPASPVSLNPGESMRKLNRVGTAEIFRRESSVNRMYENKELGMTNTSSEGNPTAPGEAI